MQGGSSVGKKVNALVQEQLQYCRSLRRADMLSTMQVGRCGRPDQLLQAMVITTVLRFRGEALRCSSAYIRLRWAYSTINRVRSCRWLPLRCVVDFM